MCTLILAGCDPELKDCRVQNDTQRRRIAELESEAASMKLNLDQLNRQLEAARQRDGLESGTLMEKIAVLEKALEDKQALIDSMKSQLLGGAQLPVELTTMLEDFAAQSPDMVTFDAATGVVKFKSDLLFEPGSDTVAANAINAVNSLCQIMNSEQGRQFDIIIAGHTDDIPIGKPETRRKHPTNWHLSAHRAISVLDIMQKNTVDSGRLSVRGFGEYRPIAPNAANKKGNVQNRRVEIYIVAKGM
jgi:chemotaxis protein MotB